MCLGYVQVQVMIELMHVCGVKVLTQLTLYLGCLRFQNAKYKDSMKGKFFFLSISLFFFDLCRAIIYMTRSDKYVSHYYYNELIIVFFYFVGMLIINVSF